MDNLFLSILNMSFTASYVIVIVVLLRLFLKKVPKVYSYALWAVVWFRLICPVSFESVFSLLPIRTEAIPQDIIYVQTPKIYSGLWTVDNIVNNVLPPVTSPYSSINPIQILIFLGQMIWQMGIVFLLLYSISSVLRLRRKLREASNIGENIYLSKSIKTPFVLGIIKPRIYLPLGLTKQEQDYILRHEQTHIQRKDHVIKVLAFLVLCVHWFNPLVWLAFVLMTKDMEMSCDETVIKEMGNEIKKDYSTSLLALAAGHRIIAGTPLAFGEGEVKGRVKNVLKYKKPKMWIAIIAAFVILVVVIGLMANPTFNRSMVEVVEPEKLNEEESYWYAKNQGQEGTFVYQSQQDYLIYYYTKGNRYAYFEMEAKIEGNFLLVDIVAKDAVTESRISNNALARIHISRGNIENLIIRLDETNVVYDLVSTSQYPDWLEKAYEWRTNYVGDASAVGNITDAWYTIADATKDGFELHTDEEPYGATIKYTSQMEPEEVYQNYSSLIDQNAIILFSLVENLGYIEIQVNDQQIAIYSRFDIESLYGDIWTQSKTLLGLYQLYLEIE